MAYNWAQLSFVERWRLHAVRGQIIGMYRPEDRTLFDLRLRPGEGNVGQIGGRVELRLVDAGDIIREKRIALMAHVPVIVRVVASVVEAAEGTPSMAVSSPPGKQRSYLEAGTPARGTIEEIEGTTILLNLGLPAIVEVSETPAGIQSGQIVQFTVEEAPKGFFVV